MNALTGRLPQFGKYSSQMFKSRFH
jgi:hypothetical protein